MGVPKQKVTMDIPVKMEISPVPIEFTVRIYLGKSGEAMSDSKNTANGSTQRCPVSHISANFDAFDGDSYGFYARARREEPVFYSPQLDYWVVTRYEDVERVMLDSETFSAANVLELFKPLCPEALKIAVDSGVRISPSIVDEDPPIHTRKRKALRGPFSASSIARLEPRVRQLVTHSI